VAELVGVFSVVASLVFVGLEIRQGAEATRTATVQEVVDGWKEINIWLATDQSWLEARLAFDEAEDPSHLSYVVQQTLRAGWRTIFHQWMVGHYHFSRGALPEELWSGFVAECRPCVGTGLGTTYAYLVTKAHGGELTVSSNEADGTALTVRLPLSQSQ